MSHPIRTSALIAAASALALSAVAPALAQDPVPAQPAAPAAPPAATTAAPAAPASPAAPDAAAAQPPAAPETPAAPAAPAEPPPTLPTSGDGAIITTLLTNVCEPLVRGGKVDQIAKANGLKLDRKTQWYIMPLSPKTPYQVGLEGPGTNPNVCTLHIQYAQGGENEKQIRDSLNIWRFLHSPQLFLHRNEQGASVNGREAVTITWDNRDNIANDGKMFGLVFRQEKNPDGSSISKNFDQGVVQYTIRTGFTGKAS